LKIADIFAEPDAVAVYGADFVLIRPDQIVAWRGSAPVDNAEAIFRQLMGHSVLIAAEK
jgi:hypothetical protein